MMNRGIEKRKNWQRNERQGNEEKKRGRNEFQLHENASL
jgi:hypothetical protein